MQILKIVRRRDPLELNQSLRTNLAESDIVLIPCRNQ